MDRDLKEQRDKKRYSIVKIKPRTFITELGALKIQSYIYLDNTSKKPKYVALLDESLNWPKWAHLDPDFVEKLKKEMGKAQTYKQIINKFPGANITTMTLSRIYKSVKNDDKRNQVDKKIKLENKQIVYINTDDSFPNVKAPNNDARKWITRKHKRHHFAKVRTISFCTGYDPKTLNKNRKKLANKRTTFFYNKEENLTTQQLAVRVFEIGCMFYENFENAILVVGGDGANWIRNLAYFLEAHFILDRFHAVRELKKAFNDIEFGDILINDAINFFYSGNFKALILLFETVGIDPDIIKYFKNNKVGVENQSCEWNIGVSAESDVSRVVKIVLGYNRRTYSAQVLKNLLNDRVYKLNNNYQF